MHTSCVQQGGASDVGTNRGGEESGLSDITSRPRDAIILSHAESSVSVQESISVPALEWRPRRDDESGSLTQEDSQEMFRRE